MTLSVKYHSEIYIGKMIKQSNGLNGDLKAEHKKNPQTGLDDGHDHRQ